MPFLEDLNKCVSLGPRKQEIQYPPEGWPRCRKEALNEEGVRGNLPSARTTTRASPVFF